MATLKEAETARALSLSRLAKAGVNAVGVERATDDANEQSWVIVAHVDPGSALRIPKYLRIPARGGHVRVPVRVAPSERYELG